MLGNHYALKLEISNQTVVKSGRINSITISSGATQKEQSMNLLAQHNYAPNTYNVGMMYHKTYTNFCCYCIPNPYTPHAYELEMNNQKVAESKIPICFPCLGPFPVENKTGTFIGEIKPNCYAFRWLCAPIAFCHPACMELQVRDQQMNQVYAIRRVPCTCYCCSQWQVYNMMNEIKSEIYNSGCCSTVINLPPDNSEENKKLIMCTLPYLP